MRNFVLAVGLSWSFLCAWALSVHVRLVAAEGVANIVADSDNFKESYDNTVPVSGSVIVGVRLGEADGNVSVGDTQLAALSTTSICVRVITRDGRFSASNIYKLAEPLHEVHRVRLSPMTLKYAQALSSYKQDDLAVTAFDAKNGTCFPYSTAYLPQLASQQRPWQDLTVLINSGGRYSVLRIRDKLQKIHCQPISQGAKIAYDQKCRIPTNLLAEGINTFILTMDDSFEEETVSFSVVMPHLE